MLFSRIEILRLFRRGFALFPLLVLDAAAEFELLFFRLAEILRLGPVGRGGVESVLRMRVFRVVGHGKKRIAGRRARGLQRGFDSPGAAANFRAMPIYVYETTGKKPRQFELKQSMADAPLTHDPETGEPVRRVISGGFGLLQKAGAKSAGTAPGQGGCGSGCGCH